MRTIDEHATATAIITLMRGVVYREKDEHVWVALERYRAAVSDHFAEIGIDVIIDALEGYAYLSTKKEVDGEEPLPRLIRRRTLTYHASLLAVLLRKRLAEFEAGGSEGRLVLTKEAMVDMLTVFAQDSTNQARIVDGATRAIVQLRDMGFVQELRNQTDAWEVKRVLKAYVDAETMGDFAALLKTYADDSAIKEAK